MRPSRRRTLRLTGSLLAGASLAGCEEKADSDPTSEPSSTQTETDTPEETPIERADQQPADVRWEYETLNYLHSVREIATKVYLRESDTDQRYWQAENYRLTVLNADDGTEAWHLDLDQTLLLTTTQDGTTFVRTGEDSESSQYRIAALDGTGTRRWSTPVESRDGATASRLRLAAVSSDAVYVEVRYQQSGDMYEPPGIVAIERGDRTERWRRETEGPGTDAIVVGDTLYYGLSERSTVGTPTEAPYQDGETFVAFDTTDGTVRWRTEVVAYLDDSKVASFGTRSGTPPSAPPVQALDQADQLQRRLRGISLSGPPSPSVGLAGVIGGVLYISIEHYDTPDGLYAFDPDTGEELWHINAEFGSNNPFVVDSTMYHSDGETFVARAVADGSLLWSVDLTEPIRDWVVAGGRVFVGGHGGTLVALDANTGYRIWNVELKQKRVNVDTESGEVVFAHSAASAEGSKNLRAFDAATGRRRWAWLEDAPSLKIVRGGSGYAIQESVLYEINGTDGSINWEFSRASPERDVQLSGIRVCDVDSIYLSGGSVLAGCTHQHITTNETLYVETSKSGDENSDTVLYAINR